MKEEQNSNNNNNNTNNSNNNSAPEFPAQNPIHIRMRVHITQCMSVHYTSSYRWKNTVIFRFIIAARLLETS